MTTLIEKVLLSRPTEKCVIWGGYIDKDGYGKSGNTTAHRLVYEKLVDPIPKGLEIDHLCQTRSCVNIKHLEIVTRAENNIRSGHRRTHCKHGHEYSKSPVYIDPKGARACVLCRRKRTNSFRAKRRELCLSA